MTEWSLMTDEWWVTDDWWHKQKRPPNRHTYIKTRHWNRQASVAVCEWTASHNYNYNSNTELQNLVVPRIFLEFREIPWKHGNSAATAKFRGSARNSAARGKLWSLLMSHFCFYFYILMYWCKSLIIKTYILSHKVWVQHGVFWIWQIEWHDHHFCHATGSDHV